MLRNEPLREFERRLRDDGMESLKAALELNKDDYAWTNEVFGDSAIFDVSMSMAKGGGSKFYRMEYSRDMKSGEFTFKEPVEVRKVVSYEPITVTKSATGEEDDIEVLKVSSVWDGIV